MIAKDVGSTDSAWEYEYDYENPEVIYLTVDFSTHAPPGLSAKRAGEDLHMSDTRKSQSMNARKPRKRKRQQSDTQDAEPTDAPTLESSVATPRVDRGDSPAAIPTPALSTINNATASVPAKKHLPDRTPPGSKTIQVLDLHSRNPLITYNSQFYTCHWATDLGTSLYLSPPPSKAPSHAPLRSFPDFDILAKTRSRLVAVPASLKPALTAPPLASSQATNPFHDPSDPESKDFTIDTAEGDRIFLSRAGEMKIHTPADASGAKKAQARFLERWGELKARKGWKDPIPIKAMRQYRVPEGWEEERRRWAEVETGGKVEKGKSRRRRGGRGLGPSAEDEGEGDQDGRETEEPMVVPDDIEAEDDEDDDDDGYDEDEDDGDVRGGADEEATLRAEQSQDTAASQPSQASPAVGVLRF